MRSVATATVRRPREEVFDFIAEPANLPAWTGTTHVTREDDGRVQVGTRYTSVGDYGGRSREYVYEVERCQRPDAYAIGGEWSSGLGPVPVSISFDLDPVAEGTRVRYEAELMPGSRSLRVLDVALGWLIRRVMHRQQQAELATIKTRLESSA